MSNTSQVETVSNSGDKVKLILAVVILIAGIFAYSFFTDYNIYIRLGMFIVGLVVAIALAATSDTGKRAFGFATGSYAEMKRVVWPTRKETIQMTGIVFAFVAVMALLLWVIDKLITWIVYGVVLGWN
ncbi:preprotein translocase subunit SecE [Pelistega europaea]|uniref:Protein translocase subunit SecE n=1 Tax=Pelistega europaea TaxID=106147 RepID=A0A7Y4P5P9_9BURK|nr:preprotein translocase subunit SecE [Pelistega europaea]NOL50023.1 preprotein translocase subunit SecE [Pelistega europaea]